MVIFYGKIHLIFHIHSQPKLLIIVLFNVRTKKYLKYGLDYGRNNYYNSVRHF